MERRKKRPGAPKAAKEGWTSGKGAAAVNYRPTDGYVSDAEQMELDALSRVGKGKRRRWQNDRVLRKLAGELTAKDMESLFKPAPFGETGHVSLFTQATSPESIQVWDLFRSVDMDKESRVLKKWEAHVRELQRGPHAIPNAAVHAMAAWASVSCKARRAMRRANPAQVEAIEAQLLAFMEQGEGGEGSASEALVELEDSFGRLITHGLAEFHGLSSCSRVGADGAKRVVLRRRGGAGAGAPSPAAAAGVAITCCDILALLEERPEQGLNSHLLEDAYCHASPGRGGEVGGAADQLVPQMQAQLTMVAVQ